MVDSLTRFFKILLDSLGFFKIPSFSRFLKDSSSVSRILQDSALRILQDYLGFSTILQDSVRFYTKSYRQPVIQQATSPTGNRSYRQPSHRQPVAALRILQCSLGISWILTLFRILQVPLRFSKILQEDLQATSPTTGNQSYRQPVLQAIEPQATNRSSQDSLRSSGNLMDSYSFSDPLSFSEIFQDSLGRPTGNQSYSRQPVLQATGPTGNPATGNQSQLSGYSRVLWESHGFLLFLGFFKFPQDFLGFSRKTYRQPVLQQATSPTSNRSYRQSSHRQPVAALRIL